MQMHVTDSSLSRRPLGLQRLFADVIRSSYESLDRQDYDQNQQC